MKQLLKIGEKKLLKLSLIEAYRYFPEDTSCGTLPKVMVSRND
jgi:hypothetical protein